ncbi:Integral membrane protein YggT, involved in response to extracytoplasmic stress (osmotic shock) [hydrothermal vent metagenome]|uniref:Integral membrane protein YggT, involved in response to extracytoplasmic stress (Osmotic shock) n=1 Tax=hydrothermal vent metagenome TaxID=652676 RepID=A0A1W1BFT4_9ZZZZ
MIYELYGLLRTIVSLYIWVIIIASFLSFVRPDPYNPVVQVIYRLTEPTLAFIRKKLPFVVMAGIDLSPLVIIFGFQFIDIILRNILFG